MDRIAWYRNVFTLQRLQVSLQNIEFLDHHHHIRSLVVKTPLTHD